MIIDKICEKKDCTGCSACAASCPKKCISMVPDEEGFLRPIINKESCIHCGKCQKICPANHVVADDGVEPKTFAARHLDESVLMQSSSGGAFSALATEVLNNDGIVIGAGFDDHFSVIHKICDKVSDLDEIRRSKYVQSKIGDTYSQAKKYLENGKLILFCGTPCQVGGLKAYLGKDYSNLCTVDFICHGTPSPLAWEKYLEFRNTGKNSKLDSVSFRDKGFSWKCYMLNLTYSSGEQYLSKVTEDVYLRSFVSDLTLRPSCYNCSFKQIHRVSDITLADFWNADEFTEKWNDDKGISLVFIHTENGMKHFNKCFHNLESIPVPFKEAIKHNPSMVKSVSKPLFRKGFMRDIQKMNYGSAFDKYFGNSIAAKVRRRIAGLVRKIGVIR